MIKPLIKHTLSGRLERRVNRRRPLSMAWFVWMTLPVSWWIRLSQGTVAPSETLAARLLATDHPLSDLLTDRDFSNTWALTPVTILEIWRQLSVINPAAILECGCGVSTAVFAFYAQCRERAGAFVPRIYSVEHSRDWIESVTKRLTAQQLDRYVQFVEAPLTTTGLHGGPMACYDPVPLADVIPAHSIEFCLIDGPPAIDEPLSRLGCLPLVEKYLSDDCRVFLDDAGRAGEREVVARWKRLYPGRLQSLSAVTSARGLATFVWSAGRSGDDSSRAR